MPIFEYKGRNSRGELMAGAIDSPNPQAVATWLLTAGIHPVAIKQKAEAGVDPAWLKRLVGVRPFSALDLLLFTRQMRSMVKAGVPMMEALSGIQNSTAKGNIIEIIQAVRSDLDRGLELSSALARHPKSFSDFYVSMIRVGEGSGQLEAILGRLYQQLEFEGRMKEKIRNALRYPTFVLTAIAIAIGILSIYVIPVFANLFRGMKMELPLATRFLMGTSSFMISYWWAVIAAGFVAYYAFRVSLSTVEGRYQWDRFKLKFPIVGRIIYKATMARFAFSFSLASKSGVPLIQAFTLVSRVVDNAFYEQRIQQMREGVERGESMHRVAQSAGIFTSLELQMIAVGEDTGQLDDMLMQVSDMYQHEVDYEVSRLGQSLEPILLFFMATLVLTLMLGIFLPLWDMGQMARQR